MILFSEKWLNLLEEVGNKSMNSMVKMKKNFSKEKKVIYKANRCMDQEDKEK